jgi:hypothetical protein
VVRKDMTMRTTTNLKTYATATIFAIVTTFIVSVLIWLTIRSEICIGICMDNDGNGFLYNGEPYYNYISYSGTDAIYGDVVVTYDLLNPFNTYTDDIVYRADFIVENKTR